MSDNLTVRVALSDWVYGTISWDPDYRKYFLRLTGRPEALKDTLNLVVEAVDRAVEERVDGTNDVV